MPNPLYNQLMGSGNAMQAGPTQQMSGMQFANPMQKMAYIMQAMTNPAAFVKQHFPDIPDSISNDPNQVLRYLQNTRGITDQQIQMAANQIPPGMR